MSQEFSVIGKPVPQKDGIERVTGRAKYFADVMTPGTLHCKILRSRYAQADIVNIDTRDAEALPGVELVMTYENFPQVCKKDVHYVGDEFGAVIAVDDETAEEALDLIRVEYDPKPFVLNIEDAMRPDAPQVFPDRPNVRPGWGKGYKWYYFSDRDPVTGLWTSKEPSDFHGFGDVEKGFIDADVIVEDRNLSQAYSRVTTMEPRGCVASFEYDKLTVWTHSQGLHHTKHDLAKTFGLPVNKINVVSPYTGGSFGGKVDRFHLPVAATLSLHKPVKLVYTREEEMLCGWARGGLSHVKFGFKKDGSLTTMDIEHWVEIGPDGDANPVRNVFRHTGAMLYARHCEHLRIRAGVVFTNRKSIGWHGYGCPETNFMIETVMDEAAYVLGLDPVELRRVNHFTKGDPIASPRNVKVNAQISSSGLKECLDEGVAGSRWDKQWSSPEKKEGRIREGLGMALSIHGAGDGLSSNAIVKVLDDATILFECGIADIGQGQHTVQCQIVAEVMGVPYENVRIICDDTDSTPYATRAGGSQGTWHQGKATYLAALDAKKKVLQRAAESLGDRAEELDIKNGKVFRKDIPDKTYSFAEIFNGWSMIIGVAQSLPDGIDQAMYPREQVAQFGKFAVDTETGIVSIIDYVPAQYVGRALNPKIVAGQIRSAVYHGLESAFYGECITDPHTGKLLTYNWENYKPMTMLDFEIKPAIVEIPGDTSHPFGAVACGEGAINPVCAVCGNAIFNAIGVRLKTTPFTPDKVLRALGKITDKRKKK
jgi:xanthine dehydrogenase molybdenum-binding subunit